MDFEIFQLGFYSLIKENTISDWTQESLAFVVPVTKMAGRLDDVKNLVTFSGCQIIIVHDIRDHATQSELEKIAKLSNICTLISGEFGSPGGARERGFAEVDRDFVTFVDSDDENFSGAKYKEVLANFESMNFDMLVSGFSTLDPDGNKKFHSPLPGAFDEFALYGGLWRIIFSTYFLRNNSIHFTSLPMGEDIVYILDSLAHQPHCITSISEIYGYRTGHPQQAMANRNSLLSTLDLLRVLSQRFKSFGDEPLKAFVGAIWIRSLFGALRRVALRDGILLILESVGILFLNPALLIRAVTGAIHLIKLKRVEGFKFKG